MITKKITKIPFDDLFFVPLSSNHDLSPFCCTDSDLNEFLIENARIDQQRGISLTWLVTCHEETVGYLTLTNDSISKKIIASEDGEDSFKYPKYPAIKIARLATHRDYEGRNIGTSMIIWARAISLKLSQEYTGCRILTVDSKPESEGFYKRKGFKRANKKKHAKSIAMYRDNLR